MKILLHLAAALLFWMARAHAQTANPVGTETLVNPTSTLTTATQTISSATACTSASPSVYTWTANALVNGMAIVLGGTQCTAFVAGTVYYVVARATNSFELAATPGGAAINATGSATPTSTIVVAQNSLIASANSSPTVPSISLARITSGSFRVPRLRLSTNVTAGWNQASLVINFWTAAPTYGTTNYTGSFAQYNPSAGAAAKVGSFSCILAQYGDGAEGECSPTVGTSMGIALASGQSLFWDVDYVGTTALTSITGQTFTLTAEDYQH